MAKRAWSCHRETQQPYVRRSSRYYRTSNAAERWDCGLDNGL
jgi:hypothetical protein